MVVVVVMVVFQTVLRLLRTPSLPRASFHPPALDEMQPPREFFMAIPSNVVVLVPTRTIEDQMRDVERNKVSYGDAAEGGDEGFEVGFVRCGLAGEAGDDSR